MRASFEKDGRWAVAVVAVFKVVAIVLNWLAFDAWPLAHDRTVNVVLLVCAVAFVATRKKYVEWVATVIFALVLLGTAFLIG